MNILNVTAGSVHNWGDAVIQYVMREAIGSLGHDVFSAPLVGSLRRHSSATEASSLIDCLERTVGRMVPEGLKEPLRRHFARSCVPPEIDGVIIGGGQLLLPGYLPRLEHWIEWANQRAVPIFLFGVGAEGSIRQPLETLMPNLMGCRHIYVRDAFTQAWIHKAAPGVACDIVPDIAYALPFVQSQQVKPRHSTVLIPVDFSSIQRYGHVTMERGEYINWWVAVAEREARQGRAVELLWATDGDRRVALEVERIGLTRGLKFSTVRLLDVTTFIRAVAEASRVISGRMHPLIIGQTFGRETIPFIRNRKLEAFWHLRGTEPDQAPKCGQEVYDRLRYVVEQFALGSSR